MLNVAMMNLLYAGRFCAQGRYAERHYVACHMLSVVEPFSCILKVHLHSLLFFTLLVTHIVLLYPLSLFFQTA